MIISVTGQTGAHMKYCLWAPECDAAPLARNNTLPVSIQHMFTRYEGKQLNTRQQLDLVDKFARTNVRAMSMRIVGVDLKLWNALDHCLKNSKTRCIFSKSYKENVLIYRVFFPKSRKASHGSFMGRPLTGV